jgi:Zn-dependent alcohol dehydrogenase
VARDNERDPVGVNARAAVLRNVDERRTIEEIDVDMPALVDRYMQGTLPLNDMLSGSVARSVIVFDE